MDRIRHLRRRSSRRSSQHLRHWLTVTLTLALVPLVLLRPASAWDPTAPAPCFLDSGQVVCETPEPASLLSTVDLEAMGPQKAASFRALEHQAIENTLADHDLPDSDWSAVATWARSDAQAELFALVLEAVETDPAQRTADQQNVAAWLGRHLAFRTAKAAVLAGEEYAKFAGLDVDDYNTLVNNGAGEAELRDFLDDPVQPYDASGVEHATGGYCRYRPPEPYQGEYDGHTLQTCYTPCSTFYCTVNVPTFDQFVRWGQVRATRGIGTGTDYFAHASAVALGATFAAAPMIGAAAAAAWPALLAAVSAGQPIFMALTGAAWAVDLSTAAALEGVALLEAGLTFLTEAEIAVAAVAAEAAAIGGAVATVIASIVMIVLEGIKVFDELALPGKLAALVAAAPDTTVDPATVLDDAGGLATLYEIFIGLTLPGPSLPRCDRYDPPQWYEPQCLNAPSIPPAAADDPHFVVTAPDGSTRESATIDLDSLDGVSRVVRTDGRWFVQRRAQGDQVGWTQDLGLTYTDWEGHSQRVWLVGDETAGFTFTGVQVGAVPATCETDHTCWTRRRIDYVGSDGKKYSATLAPYRPVPGEPRVLTAMPFEGQPVQMTAGGFSPPSPTGAVTHTWSFQRAGCSLTCLAYDGPAAGSEVTHTWNGDGTFRVELTATDGAGRVATTSFDVVVAGLSPRLTVYPACSPTVGTSCNRSEWPAGGKVALWGSVSHTFASEDERVTVDWGDGSADWSVHGPNRIGDDNELDDAVRFGDTSATSFMIVATHTYAAAGTYHATVTVRDNTGHTVTETFTERITVP